MKREKGGRQKCGLPGGVFDTGEGLPRGERGHMAVRQSANPEGGSGHISFHQSLPALRLTGRGATLTMSSTFVMAPGSQLTRQLKKNLPGPQTLMHETGASLYIS